MTLATAPARYGSPSNGYYTHPHQQQQPGGSPVGTGTGMRQQQQQQQQIRALPRVPVPRTADAPYYRNDSRSSSAPPSPHRRFDNDETLNISAPAAPYKTISPAAAPLYSQAHLSNAIHAESSTSRQPVLLPPVPTQRLPPQQQQYQQRPLQSYHASHEDMRRSAAQHHPYSRHNGSRPSPPSRKPVRAETAPSAASASAKYHSTTDSSSSNPSTASPASSIDSHIPSAHSSVSSVSVASTTPTKLAPALAIDPTMKPSPPAVPALRMVSNSPSSMSPRGSPVPSPVSSPAQQRPLASLPPGAAAPSTSIADATRRLPSGLSQSVPPSSGTRPSLDLVDRPQSRSATPSSASRSQTPQASRTTGTDQPDESGSDSDDTASNVPVVSRRPLPLPAEPSPSEPTKKAGKMSRFKKAFGGKSSSKQDLTDDFQIDGNGPVTFAELRRASTSSSDETSGVRRTFTRTTTGAASSSASTFGGASTMSGRPPTARRMGLFSSKTNGSTDNLSLASTMSSASMLIRKLGNVGKSARRSSLMSLTKAFKSKDKDSKAADRTASSSFAAPTDVKTSALAASPSFVVAEAGDPKLEGMTPAAALARQHQLQYAEQERLEALERERQQQLAPPNRKAFTQHDRHDSDSTSVKSGRFGWGKSGKPVDSDAASIATTLSGKGTRRKWGFGSLTSSRSAPDLAALADKSSIRNEPIPYDAASIRSTDGASFNGSVEVLNHRHNVSSIPYAAYGATYDAEQEYLGSSSRPASRNEHYEASIRTLPAGPGKAVSRPVKGILKRAESYNQEDFVMPSRPFAARNRASSFDAPAQHARPGSPGNVALVGRIPSDDQVDGLSHGVHNSHRLDTHPSTEHTAADGPASQHPSSMPYSNPSLNASAPVLQHPKVHLSTLRSASTPGSSRRIAFAPNLSIHTTWPANVYDRRAEPATCNRLTPALAQRIKEELNAFKMEEMEVHPTSRALTHFFV